MFSLRPLSSAAVRRVALARDNCRCSKCVNQMTRQRNFDTFGIPPTISSAEPPTSNKDGVIVKWTDGHESLYSWDLIQHYFQNNDRAHDAAIDIQPHHWGAELAQRRPTVEHDEVMKKGDAGIAKLTEHIRKFGVAFVTNTPYDDPDKTRLLLERIGPIRVTHYGGFYDFIPDMAMADTAYTNIALPGHTDTTYFTEPAGLQAFHLLSHQPAPGAEPAEGGKSLLVDGFNAAQILKRDHPADYDVLAETRIPWHASGNEGITIAPNMQYPVLEAAGDMHKLFRVRWNNDDRGVVPFGQKHTVEEWYAAARKWNEILKSNESEFWFQLEPGTVVIFDNWRVLHGRSAFSGIRRICGGYINRDDFVSRYMNTNFGRELSLQKVIG
ncbi:trimethyllysine dioxygenase [Trichocladium antarcticum]|uniref:trimethyllysine dioxygenase n=1 Tax=Trichocladium antarcticum TaxID=1450529 RepID=A0AAN6ZGU5_9PEZI|nr:trimethyllysine dioxygenase [Trichocladium antarcticum]